MRKNQLLHYCTCLLSLLCITLASCLSNELDNVKKGLDELEDRVSAIEEAVNMLESAYKQGKLITSIESITCDDCGGGYLLTFSDGGTIALHNGIDGLDGIDGEAGEMGVTPVMKIDNGYWCVSYDGGLTFDFLTDAAGNPIKAVGDKGDAGISVRVVVSEDGYYCFELYSPDSPDDVIDTIKTLYISDASSILQSIVQDDNTGVITITMADGTKFCFNLDIAYPTGIVVLTDKVTVAPNAQSVFEFRVNPSNARFEPVVDGENANLQLDMVGTRADAAASYVTVPDNYRLVSVEKSKTSLGEIKQGQYTAVIEDSGKSYQYSENVVVVLTTRDGKGEKIQLSSSLLEICSAPEPYIISLTIGQAVAVETEPYVMHVKLPYGTDVTSLSPKFTTNGAVVELKNEQNGSKSIDKVDFSNPVTFVLTSSSGLTKEYKVVVHYSNLPIVYITTPSAITSKNDWTKNCEIEIWNAGDLNGSYADVQIKGRGNTTWGYVKKPYAIKLDKKATVLGMPKHKRWVLLANYLDRTCLRNDIAFEIARRLPGLDWTPRGESVEVVMNGVFLGNYYLCEQIKIDENRVNIAEIDPADISGDAVTGGYIFELDTYYDELFKFRTKFRNLPVQFKDPDENIADEQFNYVQNYFNTVEDILYGGDELKEDVFNYIDMDSFIDWWLVYELTGNTEPAHPKSSYMNKDRNGKLKAGPVWDFDWGSFRSTSGGLKLASALWYSELLKNEKFVARAKERWNLYKGDLSGIDSYIASKAAEIQESAEANLVQWPNDNYTPNYDQGRSFTDCIAVVRQIFNNRMVSLDAAINAL